MQASRGEKGGRGGKREDTHDDFATFTILHGVMRLFLDPVASHDCGGDLIVL